MAILTGVFQFVIILLNKLRSSSPEPLVLEIFLTG